MAKRTAREYAKALYLLTKDLEKGETKTAVDVFLSYLKKEQALSRLPEIVEAFERIAEAGENGVLAHITTAREITQAEMKKIAHLFGDKVEYNHTVDPTLNGGFIAKTENISIDASLKSMTNRLRNTLVS